MSIFNKRSLNKIIISAVVILIVLGVVLIFSLFKKSDQQETGPSQTAGEPFLSATPTANVNEDEKTVVHGVEVNNFFKEAKVGNRQGDLKLNKDYDYSIIYLNNSNKFLISITGSPFDTVRNRAEQEFARLMGASVDNLCRMDVSITTPSYANPEEAGQSYGLSFCE